MTDVSINGASRVAAVTDGDGIATPIASVGDFVQLLKPRVMSLVVLSGLVGLVLAPGQIHPMLGLTAILCIAVAAGASGAINMWYDRDIDAVMARTRGRPIPSGRVAPDEALGFGLALAILSVIVMALATNFVAAALLASTVLFYVLVYTMWLKRRTPQNIVIGGAAGALPPMIGWAAVTGDVGMPAIALFALIFFWTPPHFWALALYRSEDYARAGVPMMPVVAGDRETKRQILLYSAILAPLGLAPYALGAAGPLYAGLATLLGALLMLSAWRVWRARDDRPAKQLFGYSILYLFLLLSVLLAEGTGLVSGLGMS